jgi:hypothetical protein
MYFYCYVYVFLLYVYIWLPCLRFFHALSSVVRKMPDKNGKNGARPEIFIMFVLLYILFLLCRSMYCLCVYVYCTTAVKYIISYQV